jgi:genome maintenance exonuclease 1
MTPSNPGLTTSIPAKFTHLGFGRGQTRPILEQITAADGRRVYNTPTGRKYPSVTTVLAEKNKQVILDWRKRIGAEQANTISRVAAGRGTGMHKAAERYLDNMPPFDTSKTINPLHFEMFRKLMPLLDRINNIHCQETALYSHHLRLAGTVDCIGDFDGKLSVIDFKSSTKPKKAEWISSYFMQASAYAIMYEELTSIPIVNLAVLVAVEDDEPQLFIEHRDRWTQELIQWRDNYEKLSTAIDN